MATTRFALSVGTLALAVTGAPGCSSSSPAPTSDQYDDVAQSTAALVATPGGGGEIGSMQDAASLSVGASPGDVNASASGSWSGVHGGVTYDFTLTCTSASGAALPACGPTTNDATASVTWSGNLAFPGYSATVNRNGSWTLTGIQSGTATLGGQGTFTLDAQFQSLFRAESATLDLSYSANYDAVTYSFASHEVTGGSVTYAIQESGSYSGTNGAGSGGFTMNAVLTFLGNGAATLTIDGSHTYQISASGTVTKV